MEPEPAAEVWPEGYLRVYRDGISTRAVEIQFEDNTFHVRIMALSNLDDYELAFRVIEVLAPDADAAVEPEDGDPFAVSRPRRIYNGDWIEHQVGSAARMVTSMATRPDAEIAIEGPRRTCYLGPVTMAAVVAAGPPDDLPRRLLATIRGYGAVPISKISSARSRRLA